MQKVKGAAKFKGFAEDGLYGANEYIYHYTRSIELDYFMMGGGKKAFRRLAELLVKGVYFTPEYKHYRDFLEKEAKKPGCEVNDIDINDEHFNYERVKW